MVTGTSETGARAGLALSVLFAVAGAGGCAPRGEVVLHQEFAPPSQRELHLTSRWTFTSVAYGRRNCLLAFPLPGVKDGPRDFFLYVSTPADEGEFRVAADGVRGFLIQQVGQLSGKAVFVAGTVRVRRRWLALWGKRLELTVRCADGTLIEGHAMVADGDDELRSFERRYAADIVLLSDGGAVGDEPAAETMRRETASP